MFAEKGPSMRRRTSFLSCFFPEPAYDDWHEQRDDGRKSGQRGMLQVNEPASPPAMSAGAALQKSPSAAATTSPAAPIVAQTAATPKPTRTVLVYSKNPTTDATASSPSLPAASPSAAPPAPASAAPPASSSGAAAPAFVPFVPHPSPSRSASTLQAQLDAVMDQRTATSSSLASATQHLDAVNSQMQRLVATADLLGLEMPAGNAAGGTSSRTPEVHLLDTPVATVPHSWQSPHLFPVSLSPVVPSGPPSAFAPPPPLPVSHHPGLQPMQYSSPRAPGPPVVAPQAATHGPTSTFHPSASWVEFDDARPPAQDLRASASAPNPATTTGQPPSTQGPTSTAATQPPAQQAAPSGTGPTTSAPAQGRSEQAAASREDYAAGMSSLQSDVAQTKAYMAEMAAKLEELQKQEAQLREALAASASTEDQLQNHNTALAKELEAHEMIYASTIAETSTLHRDLQVTRAELNAVKAAERQKDELIEILQAQLADTQQQLFETQDGALQQ